MKPLPQVIQLAWILQVAFHRTGFNHGTARSGRRVASIAGAAAVSDDRWRRFSILLLAGLFLWTAEALAQPGATLAKIAAGTVVDDEVVQGWSHRVLVARPRVASGDVDDVSATIKKHAELFSFVVLARVEEVPERDPPAAVLQEVGVGLAAEIEGRLRVVSGPAARDPQLAGQSPQDELGFIAKRVLLGAERSLDEMRLVVRRTTLLIYDSPAVINLNGSNQTCVVRSMLWIEPRSGKLHHAVWTMQKSQQQRWVPAWEHGVYLPVPFEEDRLLHVDSRQFSFGIPAATAFALASLPPGHPFSLAGRLGKLACQETYDEAELGELAVGLIAALRRETRRDIPLPPKASVPIIADADEFSATDGKTFEPHPE